MAVISKIRLSNIVYENGKKRYNDELFIPDGNNTVFLLENGGGKTVLVQMIIQAILPRHNHAGRKIRETLMLDSNPAHIAVEWILNEHPRRYLLTAVTLYIKSGKVESHIFVNEYGFEDKYSIENLPFSIKVTDEKTRPASHGEVNDYFLKVKNETMHGKTFDTLNLYQDHLETNYQISYKEWLNISKINSTEGGIDAFFDNCSTTSQLVNNLIIPTIEEALEGESAELFTETFENHRQHLKQYKLLSDTINENHKIKDHIDKYVLKYKDYDDALNVYTEEKSLIKGVYERVQEELRKVNEDLLEKEHAAESFEKEVKELIQKEKSLEIAFNERRFQSLAKEFENVAADLVKVEKAIEHNEVLSTKLKTAKRIMNKNEYRAELDGLNKKLSALEISEDIQKHIDEKEHIKSMLAYIYNNQIRDAEAKNIKLENKIGFCDGQIKNAEDEGKILRESMEWLNISKGNNNGKSEVLQNEIDASVNDLIDLESIETIKPYKEECLERMKTKSKDELDINNKIKDLKSDNVDLEEYFKKLNQAFNKSSGDAGVLNSRIEAIQETDADLYEKFKALTGRNTLGKSLYTDSKLIESDMDNRLDYLKKSKEDSIIQESASNYKHHLYKESDHFMADPLFMQNIEKWKNSYGFLETGSQYVEGRFEYDQVVELYEAYPYWPITLVTLESERQHLIDKLSGHTKKLEHPIFVLSDKDVKDILSGEWKNSDNSHVIPESWIKNLDGDCYEEWKNNIYKDLIQLQENRRIYEEEIKAYESLKDHIEAFYVKYPRDEYEVLKEEFNILTKESQRLEKEIENNRRKIKFNGEEIDRMTTRLGLIVEEKNTLERHIITADKIIRNLNEIRDLKGEIYKLELEIKKSQENLNNNERVLEQLKETFDGLNVEISGINYNLDLLKMNPSYTKVKDCDLEEADKPKETLEIDLKTVEDLINEKENDIEDIGKNIEQFKKELEEANEDIDDGLKKLETTLDEFDFLYPADGRAQERKLGAELEKIKIDYNKISEDYTNKKSKVDVLRGSLDTLIQSYHGELIIFDTSLEIIEEDIKIEKTALHEKEIKLKREQETFRQLQNDVSVVIIELDKKNERHGFLNERITTLPISESIFNDYQYDRLGVITKLLTQVEGKKESTDKYQVEKDRAKQYFRNYCINEIFDPKLKKMTLSIIDNRDDYDEVLQWQTKLSEIISKVIDLSEHALREHDEEIVKLIDRLFIYIKKVIQELSLIESKTRVKLKNDSKKIFSISAPEFTDTVAKQTIREHLVWMSNKLQSENYKNEHGKEDIAMMKKDITNWLSTKNLLNKVFIGKEIKVKCRKVTNDSMISSSPTDWSHTNKWSGGEKWSKNMTLFLGLQNYLAEKRHVDIAKNNRNRTVLLDNPFGAASSSHVLEPVFLIAEQLGYQLIGFTAHTEGKFISDYFPIVYSCKLRSSKDDKVQIMTKDKEINYAFLRDHNPTSILRLDEDDHKQLSLFSK